MALGAENWVIMEAINCAAAEFEEPAAGRVAIGADSCVKMDANTWSTAVVESIAIVVGPAEAPIEDGFTVM